MSKLIYLDFIKGGRIYNAWEQAVKDAIDDNSDRIDQFHPIDNTGFIANPDFIVTGGTATYKDVGAVKVVYLTEIASYTLPEISSLTGVDFKVEVKNISGGVASITTSGSDKIEISQTTITLDDGERVDLDIFSSTEFKL